MLVKFISRKAQLLRRHFSFSLSRDFSERAYYQHLGEQTLLYRNLGEQIQRAAELYSQLPAFISCHEQRRVTFAQAKYEGEQLAIQLSQLGLRPGDHLGIWAPNTTQWYITFMAAALGGFPLVCINPGLQAQELAFALRKARVKALITMDKFRVQSFSGILNSLLTELPGNRDFVEHKQFPYLRHIVVKGQTKQREFLNYDNLMGKCVSEEERRILNEVLVPGIAPESACNIQFTSGTTGSPKAALLSHFNHVNMGTHLGKFLGMSRPNMRFCLNLPLFHAFGIGILVSALTNGVSLVSPSALFDAKACLETIEKEQCQLIAGTPTMYIDMVQQQQQLKKCLDSLDYGVVGGAACTPEVFKKTKEVLDIKRFCIAYGQSECTLATFAQEGTETMEEAVSTIGRLMPNSEAKVINEQGETVGFGESGELCIRGYCTMLGYFEDEQKTKETICPKGWLRTG